MTEPAEAVKTLNCANCGAPIDYVEGEAVLTCAHCGTATMLAGFDQIVKIESHFVLRPKLDENAAVRAVRDYLSKGFFKAKDLPGRMRLTAASGRVLPYWIVSSTGATSWRGMKKRTRTTGTGDKKRTEEWWEPVEGRFTESYTWPVYAREDPSEFWGLQMFEPGTKCVFPDWGGFFLNFGMGSAAAPNANLLEGRSPFGLEGITDSGMKIVNGQIIQSRAEEQARARITEKHEQAASSNADRLTDCDTTVTVQGVDLVYLPVWEISYEYGSKTYRALVNASTGGVVAAEYPVGRKAKIVVFDVVFGLIGGLLVLFSQGGGALLWAGIASLGLAAGYTALSILKGK